jgi:signal transduction histidine kinase/CheY-like chemotaxis protein
VELTGYVLKAGDRLTDLIPQDWREEEIAFYLRALRGERFVVEQRYMSFTGERFYELSFNPIHGSDGVSGVAVISKDSTERHRVQMELKTAKSAAESANRLKSEFLANMSHEIRTPMNGLMGMTDLLLRTPLAPDQREFVNTMRVSGESLLMVINDILDFSKIEAGKLQFETIDFDLQEVVETTLDLFSAPALAKKLELGALTRPGVPARLRGDPSRLRQVISNLLSNAVKFTEQGEIVLTIALVRQDAAKVLLEFQMRDTGIGIDRAGQARLFEAFSQADGSMARKYGGTGLGLAISKRLVELMQGAIHVDSVPGKGSVFTFTAEFEQAQPPPALPAQLEDWRALVVSDNPTSRFLLGELFSDRQAGWRLAWNFEMAHALIEEAKDSTFDAAIVDLPCTADEVRQLAETIGTTGRCQARVIVLTLPGQRIEGLDEIPGVQALSKPIKQRRLLGLVETAAPAEAPAETERTTTAERGLRILLAEDNTINQKVACGILRNLGHSADIAINGEQVLAALADAAYDVIFMDCQMPVMDGFEATRRVRAMQIAQPKIIAMTANALPGDRERCLACGMDDYITKPIRPEMLREKLAGVR